MSVEQVALDEVGLAYVRDLAAKRKAKRDAEAAEKRAAQKVRDYLNGAEFGLDAEGKPVVRHYTVTSHRFDTKRFKDENPELADVYTVESSYEKVDLA